MDPKQIQVEISKNLIRAGPLKKRSKFLKQWRERWVVLTSNFIFTFTDKKMKEVTDILEIKQIQGIKSYLKNADEVTPNGFKVQSSENTLILMGKDLEEKWSWMVTIERLVDFKVLKSSGQCKSIEDVTTLGFKSLREYESQNQQQKPQKKEQQEEQQEKPKDTLQDVKKLIQFLKSQIQQNDFLAQSIKNNLTTIKEKDESDEYKNLQNKLNQYLNENKGSEIECVIKGILIAKKMGKEKKQTISGILDLLLEGCESEKAKNWAGQVKDII